MTEERKLLREEQIEKAAHQDWCRWWSHGDLCSCGAVSALEKPVPVEPVAWMAFDIGCIECGQASEVLGIYADEASAHATCKEAKKQGWRGGEHCYKVFKIKLPFDAAPADQWRRVEDAVAHTDHPMRHYDRTCPACNAALPEADK